MSDARRETGEFLYCSSERLNFAGRILATANDRPLVGNDLHNRPSGDPSPSAADIQLMRQLREAAAAVDIPLLDHVIIGRRCADPLGRGFYSFRDAGLL